MRLLLQRKCIFNGPGAGTGGEIDRRRGRQRDVNSAAVRGEDVTPPPEQSPR